MPHWSIDEIVCVFHPHLTVVDSQRLCCDGSRTFAEVTKCLLIAFCGRQGTEYHRLGGVVTTCGNGKGGWKKDVKKL